MPDPRPPFPAARRGVPAAGMPGPGAGVALAGLVAVAVLYLGRDLFVPLALAVLLSFVLAPVVRALRRLMLPRALAVIASVLFAFAVLAGLGTVIGAQVTVLAGRLPEYQASIARKLAPLREPDSLLERVSEALRRLERAGGNGSGERGPAEGAAVAPPAETAPAEAPRAAPRRAEGPGPLPPLPVELRRPEPSPVERLRAVAEPLLAPLAVTGIVVVLVVFILLYREDLRDRLIRLAGARDLHRTVAAMDDAALRLSRYFLALTAMNAIYGAAMAVALWLLGVPNPVLWGIVAGLMRYVPFIGSFIAVAGPLLLALATGPGWSLAFAVAALFLVGELAMGQVFEPLVFGHSTGLSPIAVIAAAAFWTWLWGPIGLLVAVPLTVCLVVLGRHVDRLEFLAVMLGDQPALEPEEVFYQRALAGDGDALVEQAERALRDAPLSAYYDEVALKGLALAQADWSRDALDAERLSIIRRQVEALLDDLADEGDEAPPEPLVGGPDGEAAQAAGAARPATGRISPVWAAPGSVLCIAGRGRLDDLPAGMLAQLLGMHGIGARAEPNAVLRAADAGGLDPRRVRLCVLSVLERGSSVASIRYFLRRVRRRLPGVPVVLGLWHAAPGSPTLTALRAEASAEGEREEVLASLREAVAFCLRAARTAAAREATPGGPEAGAAGGAPPLPAAS
ncbi:ABC transporter permease [Caldovatus sediminis]|uniref:ABC transporter permease n=1 Tax=Caldovatus sediminis TaxID=2041189 RepID=A0A8J2ZBC7_9PROT|nr:AI-2E family transporter [Caldovatus sediminis]GGG32014.1 ABC transporter permease [Caldovatus sediminis]